MIPDTSLLFTIHGSMSALSRLEKIGISPDMKPTIDRMVKMHNRKAKRRRWRDAKKARTRR